MPWAVKSAMAASWLLRRAESRSSPDWQYIPGETFFVVAFDVVDRLGIVGVTAAGVDDEGHHLLHVAASEAVAIGLGEMAAEGGVRTASARRR